MPYEYIIIPFITLYLSQLAKEIFTHKHFSLSRFILGYGGMPSSHAALMASLLYVTAMGEGFDSAAFAITLFFASVVLRDAIGIRFTLGGHGKAINKLIKSLPDKEEYLFKHQAEIHGHTPAEVAVGFIFGLVVTFLLRLI